MNQLHYFRRMSFPSSFPSSIVSHPIVSNLTSKSMNEYIIIMTLINDQHTIMNQHIEGQRLAVAACEIGERVSNVEVWVAKSSKSKHIRSGHTHTPQSKFLTAYMSKVVHRIRRNSYPNIQFACQHVLMQT